MNRREAIRIIAAATALSSCERVMTTPTGEIQPTENQAVVTLPPEHPWPSATRQPTTEPTVVFSPTETPIPQEPTATATPSPTATETSVPPEPTATAEIIQNHRVMIETAREGEVLRLPIPYIARLFRVSIPFTDYTFIFGALYEKDKFVAVLENSDCIYDQMRADGSLGEQVPGIGPIRSGMWITDYTPEEMDVKVVVDADAGSIPVLEVISFTPEKEERVIFCPKSSNVQDLGERARNAYETIRASALRLFLQVAEEVDKLKE